MAMSYRVLIVAVVSVSLGALIGMLIGQDAHANNWSRRPVYAFALGGALLLAPLALYVFGR